MTKRVVKNSTEWLASTKYKHLSILDPDGWDRENFNESWNELITEEEFIHRLMNSTIMDSRRHIADS